MNTFPLKNLYPQFQGIIPFLVGELPVASVFLDEELNLYPVNLLYSFFQLLSVSSDCSTSHLESRNSEPNVSVEAIAPKV
jgi:hypothetical protein